MPSTSSTIRWPTRTTRCRCAPDRRAGLARRRSLADGSCWSGQGSARAASSGALCSLWPKARQTRLSLRRVLALLHEPRTASALLPMPIAARRTTIPTTNAGGYGENKRRTTGQRTCRCHQALSRPAIVAARPLAYRTRPFPLDANGPSLRSTARTCAPCATLPPRRAPAPDGSTA
jgi:hypothetical protein